MYLFLKNERLIIRSWNPELDAKSAFEIYGDPVVMHYIREPYTSLEAVQTYLEDKVKRTNKTGTGSWALVEQETGELIGAILLQQLPDNQGNLTQDYEIGWHLRRSRWGQGFATEAAQCIIAYGFKTLQLPELYAVVNPQNQRSIQVTQRLKMEPLGRVQKYYGVEVLLFRLVSGKTKVMEPMK